MQNRNSKPVSHEYDTGIILRAGSLVSFYNAVIRSFSLIYPHVYHTGITRVLQQYHLAIDLCKLVLFDEVYLRSASQVHSRRSDGGSELERCEGGETERRSSGAGLSFRADACRSCRGGGREEQERGISGGVLESTRWTQSEGAG